MPLSELTGNQCNDVHPLAYAAGSQGANPNILSHDQAMKAVDKDKFELSMVEELDYFFKIKF